MSCCNINKTQCNQGRNCPEREKPKVPPSWAHELYPHVYPQEPQQMTAAEVVLWLVCSVGFFVLILLIASSYS